MSEQTRIPTTALHARTGGIVPVTLPFISEYRDVTSMFRNLSTLEPGSTAFTRQRNSIIERCLPLAEHIARKFRDRGEPYEDLVQVACVGLINAVNRFDVEQGTDFLAYAVPTIVGEVRRHFRDHGWSVKVPRRLKDLSLELKTARDVLSQQLGRAPTATELAGHLGIDREEVVQTEIANSAYSSLSSDTPRPGVNHDDDRQAVISTFGDFDTNLEKVLDIETVRPLLVALPEREQAVLVLRFFQNMTQSQIAEHLGISQMHVSRLLSRSLVKLRKNAQI
jgi:RNA polymerase sigma-B factor